MDYSPIISAAAKPLLWLTALAFLAGLLKSPWFKGLLGESLVKLAAKFRLPADVYIPMHNVTLPTADGTTQIDHIFVSCYGIFVVETKNMSGWIFGNESQAQWTQKIFRQNFKFQNPLRQNYKHVKALEDLLDVPAGTVHSVVVFFGNSTFKTPMPANVTHGGGYITYIKSFRESVLSPSVVQGVAAQIRDGRLAPTRETHRRHVEHLKARSSQELGRACPKCGSTMVLRTARKGAVPGNQFWGCSSYPKCRQVSQFSELTPSCTFPRK